jgi:hypothetical protein
MSFEEAFAGMKLARHTDLVASAYTTTKVLVLLLLAQSNTGEAKTGQAASVG